MMNFRKTVGVADAMVMRVVLVIMLTSFSGAVFPQSVSDSLRFLDRIWAMKKKALVLEYLHLTEAEKAAFWPIYESYSLSTQFVEMESISLTGYITNNVHTLSDSKVQYYSSRILNNDITLARIRKQYYKRFRKALPPDKAATFMQLDNMFRAMMRIDLQKDSPPMEALEVTLFSKAAY